MQPSSSSSSTTPIPIRAHWHGPGTDTGIRRNPMTGMVDEPRAIQWPQSFAMGGPSSSTAVLCQGPVDAVRVGGAAVASATSAVSGSSLGLAGSHVGLQANRSESVNVLEEKPSASAVKAYEAMLRYARDMPESRTDPADDASYTAALRLARPRNVDDSESTRTSPAPTQTDTLPAVAPTIAARVLRNKRKASVNVRFSPESDYDDDDLEYPKRPYKKVKLKVKSAVWPSKLAGLAKVPVNLRASPDPPEMKDFTDVPGVPKDAEDAVWCRRYKTKLPWIPKADSHHKGLDGEAPKRPNRLRSLAAHVKALAEKVKPAHHCPWIVEVQYSTQKSEEFIDRIRYEIGKGNVVVMKGYQASSPEVKLDTGEIYRRLGIVPNCDVVVHDAYERQKNMSEPYLPGPQTLEDFCKRVHDENHTQCIFQSFTSAHGVDFLPLINDSPSIHAQQDVFPDVKRLHGWAWFHHALYYSFPHFSGAGLGTCALVRSGCQFWTVARYPGFEKILDRLMWDEGEKHEKKQREMFEWLMQFARFEPRRGKGEGNGEEPSTTGGGSWFTHDYDRFLVVLEPGDVIIQPPFTLHEVYTPVPSVTTGADFYCFESMGSTLTALKFNVHSKGFLSDGGPMPFMPAMFDVLISYQHFLSQENRKDKNQKDAPSLTPVDWRYKLDILRVQAFRALRGVLSESSFGDYDDSAQFPGKDQGHLVWLQTKGARLTALERKRKLQESSS